MTASKTPAAQAPAHHLSKRTPEIEQAILQALAGGTSLVQACRAAGIHTTSFFRWMDETPALRANYAHAREAQAEFHASEIVAIADEVEVVGVMTPDGVMDFKLDPVAVARNKLRIDARKWVAAKMLPKKYGDKVETEVTGTVTHLFDATQAARMASMLLQGKGKE